VRIWLENWEWECCGEPFSLGSEVVWGLIPMGDELRSWLATPLGADAVTAITHYETHHADGDDVEPTPTRGRVDSIDAVYWKLAPHRGGDPRVLYPIASTGALESREHADGWEPETDGGPSFGGYIVELAPLRQAWRRFGRLRQSPRMSSDCRARVMPYSFQPSERRRRPAVPPRQQRR